MSKANVVRMDPDALEAEADAQIEQVKRMLAGESPQAAPQEQQQTQAGPTEDTQQPEPDRSVAATDTATEQTRAETPSYEEELRKADERVKNAQARMTRATQEAADLRRRLAELEAKLAEASKPKSNADIEKLAEDYPDIAKPLLAKIAELESKLTETGSEVRMSKEEAAREAHFAAIARVHPDYLEVAGSEAFESWLTNQTPVWQRIANQGTAEEVVDLISRYKDFNKPTLQGAEKARAAAEPKLPRQAPQIDSGKKIWTRAEIANLDYRDFERLEAEIDKAIAEGRVR